MNDVFVYNNSFVSLMGLVNHLIENKIKPSNIKNKEYSPTLFENIINLRIDNENILDNIINKTSSNVFKTIYYVYLSNDEFKELIIYYFYLNALKYKNNIFNMRKLKCVNSALKISQFVSRENHKYKGFLRFRELFNNILYAEIEPKNNILEILGKHFKQRLRNEYWIIKDVRRNLICLYDKKDILILNSDSFSLHTTNNSDNEDKYKNMWTLFYNTIGIESRKNDRCRMNFMPKRYWKYITEMEDVNEKSC